MKYIICPSGIIQSGPGLLCPNYSQEHNSIKLPHIKSVTKSERKSCPPVSCLMHHLLNSISFFNLAKNLFLCTWNGLNGNSAFPEWPLLKFRYKGMMQRVALTFPQQGYEGCSTCGQRVLGLQL